jgi:glyceraldehyde-3-phosphate dehydrogenase (NADP+)
MDFNSTLKNIFVEEKDIPADFSLPSLIHQREYLSNGEMKPWDGPYTKFSHRFVSAPKQASNAS